VEEDYILVFLQFIHNCYGAAFVWAYELGPVVIILFWPIAISCYYVLVKIFIDWPCDYRCWRGKGRCGISTEYFRNNPDPLITGRDYPKLGPK
jgi:hypothetical protein